MLGCGHRHWVSPPRRSRSGGRPTSTGRFYSVRLVEELYARRVCSSRTGRFRTCSERQVVLAAVTNEIVVRLKAAHYCNFPSLSSLAGSYHGDAHHSVLHRSGAPKRCWTAIYASQTATEGGAMATMSSATLRVALVVAESGRALVLQGAAGRAVARHLHVDGGPGAEAAAVHRRLRAACEGLPLEVRQSRAPRPERLQRTGVSQRRVRTANSGRPAHGRLRSDCQPYCQPFLLLAGPFRPDLTRSARRNTQQ